MKAMANTAMAMNSSGATSDILVSAVTVPMRTPTSSGVPTAFRNTELIYSNAIGDAVYRLGFKTMLTEGARHIMGWQSPNFVYTCDIQPKLRLLLRNYGLSDDIAFRFSNQGWDMWPLTADKFLSWVKDSAPVQEAQETQVRSLGQEVPLEEGMGTHSGILAWRIPWTEEPGGLWCMVLQKIRHDRATKHSMHDFTAL